jgi:phospholipase D1/2
VLGISHDGEHELPADDLKKHEDERRRSLKGKAKENRPNIAQYHSESHVRTETDETNDTVGNGTWRSAMSYTPSRSPSDRPAMRSRWSTFRDSTAEDSESDTASNKTPRRPRKSDSGPAPQEQDEDDAREEEMQPANPPESPQARENAQRKWSALKGKLLPSSANHMTGARTAIGPAHDKTSQVAPVPITTELLSGQLGVMMLKTWLDRDEDGRRAVPVLIGNMRFRVCESIGTGGGGHHGSSRTGPGGGIFKVECEYGDGAVKWVIYRELKDFFSLHSHYKAANFGSRVAGLRSSRPVKIPDFPKFGE